MGQAVLERVLRDIKELDTPELVQVSQAVLGRLEPGQEQLRRHEFRRALVSAGLIDDPTPKTKA